MFQLFNKLFVPLCLFRMEQRDESVKTQASSQVLGSVVALSFIVQEPRGIMEVGKREVVLPEVGEYNEEHLSFGMVSLKYRVF